MLAEGPSWVPGIPYKFYFRYRQSPDVRSLKGYTVVLATTMRIGNDANANPIGVVTGYSYDGASHWRADGRTRWSDDSGQLPMPRQRRAAKQHRRNFASDGLPLVDEPDSYNANNQRDDRGTASSSSRTSTAT